VEFRHLRYFVAVARERNFTRAAEILHMAQPPMSRQVQQLEDEMGLILVERGSRPFRLRDRPKPGGAIGHPGRCNWECGMKWRVVLELIGPDGCVGVHEVGGRAAVAEYAPRMIGLTLTEGKHLLAALQLHLVLHPTQPFATTPMNNRFRETAPLS